MTRQGLPRSRTVKAAVALAAAPALALPAVPAAAQRASNLVRSGPNLTLVVASCPGPADNAVAEALAAHARNAAKVCVDPSGLSPDPDVAGPNAVTLIVANGWNGSEVRTAADVAEQIADAAVAYISPRPIADGLPAATAALIADYRPARVVVVGLPDEAGSVTEAAIEATLDAHELTVDIERVAETGEPRFFTPEASPTVERAREIFTSIVEGTHRPGAVTDEQAPVLAASSARGPLGSGRGHRLWTVRAGGSGRQLHSTEHRGWAWNPSSGQLSWTGLDGRLRVSGLAGDDSVLFEPGQYPA